MSVRVRSERGIDGVGDDRGAGQRPGEGVADVVLQAAVDDDRQAGLPAGGVVLAKLAVRLDVVTLALPMPGRAGRGVG